VNAFVPRDDTELQHTLVDGPRPMAASLGWGILDQPGFYPVALSAHNTRPDAAPSTDFHRT